MSRYVEKKNNYQSKDGEKKDRLGFSYDRENISYRTEIPTIPEKGKLKPDPKKKDVKIEEIKEKIDQLKGLRKEKKDKKKLIQQSYQSQTEQYKENVILGKKCIKVLDYDLEQNRFDIGKLSSKINSINNKIEDIVRDIKDLRSQNRPNKKQNKPYEELTNRELDDQKRRIQNEMSTKSLTKKQEAELSSLLIKIGRIKNDTGRKLVQQEQSNGGNTDRLLSLESQKQRQFQKIQKLKTLRNSLFNEKKELQFKKICIEEDINQFIQDITNIADKYDEKSQELLLEEEAKQLKQKIYEEREKIAKINEEFQQKVKEYEVQQEQVKWISWATGVQNQKRQQWEVEKAQRKRQKLKEKTGDKKEGDKKQEGATQQKFEERRKINRNQKEIDACSFLVDYCKRLLPSANQNKTTQAPRRQVDIEKELKKGVWAKEKGVQIIQSKKSKKDEEETSTRQNKKKEETKEQSSVNKFTHEYFVSQTFNSVNIIPPTTVEELDKIIKDLQDKVEYYLSHPDQGIENKFAKDKKYVDKTMTSYGNNNSNKSSYANNANNSSYANNSNNASSQNNSANNFYNKNYKGKTNTKVINTEEFPSLA